MPPSTPRAPWSVGFALADITPPLGTHLFGFGGRDRGPGCTAIHDPLQVRAVWIGAGREATLILGFDLLFFDRGEADRIKGAIGRALDLLPRQILINCSHTHIGPVTGTWGYTGYEPLKDPAYLTDVVSASVQASVNARQAARPARLQFGQTRSTLPVSRRFPTPDGKIEWRPAPEVPIYSSLPLFAFTDARSQRPIALLFAVSCHPSTTGGTVISADYPGVARTLIDTALGRPVSLFLQGVGGDTKPSVVADGPADDTGRVSWRAGTWDDIRRAGEEVAGAVLQALPRLHPVRAASLKTALAEVALPLTDVPSRQELETLRDSGATTLNRLWAVRQLNLLDRLGALPAVAPILVQSIRLNRSLHLLALEGEPVAAWGWTLEKILRPAETVVPLGYSNGQGLYLPVETNLPEGGYEVESVYEYGFSGRRLAPGFSKPLLKTCRSFLRDR